MDNTFLPGGHLEPGESARACLARELLEETGLVVTVSAYLGMLEHGWQDAEGRANFEINHLFAVSAPDLTRASLVQSREPHLTFEWVAINDLEAHTLEPAPLIGLLQATERRPAWHASTL